MREKTFFTILVESAAPEESFVQVFWSWANHLGEAIDKVLRACRSMGIENATASEADPFDFAALPDHVIHDEKLDVFFAEARHFFPTTVEGSFIPPTGIIKSCQDGELDYELIREGFSQMIRGDGLYEVEAVIGRDQLFETFVALVRRLPSIRVFWIKIAADWEDKGREEFLVNEDLDSAESITDFLTAHAKDTVPNGHVALTAYSKVGQTNLVIDTHKTIKVLTKSAKVQSKMVARLKKLGFVELPEFYSLEYGYYHWHYRPTRSKSRSRFVAALKLAGVGTFLSKRPEY
ncbi:MAG TPA: hypothetical protein VIW80_04315 [Pyrinomonadaceae bacterium]